MICRSWETGSRCTILSGYTKMAIGCFNAGLEFIHCFMRYIAFKVDDYIPYMGCSRITLPLQSILGIYVLKEHWQKGYNLCCS